MCNSVNSNSRLARFLRESNQDESFPFRNTNYYNRFIEIDNYLNEHIHPEANIGAAAREPIWLTDHGPNHISTVIRRASDLVFNGSCVLTPYESYILLVAAHLHDVGNIFGRTGHEQKITKVLFSSDDELNSLFGRDAFEKRMIFHIAMAHGGYADTPGDKDTISKLPYDERSGPHAPNSTNARVK